jgi:hypothetical protein
MGYHGGDVKGAKEREGITASWKDAAIDRRVFGRSMNADRGRRYCIANRVIRKIAELLSAYHIYSIRGRGYMIQNPEPSGAERSS